MTPSLSEIKDVLGSAADFIKDRDGGDQHTETGWKSDEALDVWQRLRSLLSRLEEAGGDPDDRSELGQAVEALVEKSSAAPPASGDVLGRATGTGQTFDHIGEVETANELFRAAKEIERLREALASEYSRGEAAGRRSGIEEAEKIAEDEKSTLGGDDGWARGYATACEDIAKRCRSLLTNKVQT